MSPLPTAPLPSPEASWERLVGVLAPHVPGGLVVAFSGGLDSSVLLDAAVAAAGPDGPERVLAFTAVSPSLAVAERDDARRIASELGARHLEAETRELEDPGYVANAGDRCFYCKRELFRVVQEAAAARGVARLVYGYHVDDDADVRPGLKAALDAGVLRPLYEARLRKSDLRAIAAWRGRSFAGKATGACLASRIPVGTPVRAERLAKVEAVEGWLRTRRYRQFRARLDRDDVVRLETAAEELPRLAEELAHPPTREELLAVARGVGVVRVTLDPTPYRRAES